MNSSDVSEFIAEHDRHAGLIKLNSEIAKKDNIGISKEDLFEVYVIKNQNTTDLIRTSIDKTGQRELNLTLFQYNNDLNSNFLKELVYIYRFSPELASINF